MKWINYIIITLGIILSFNKAANAKNVVIHSVNDFKNNAGRGVTFIVNSGIDLKSSTILLPDNSVLYFKNGCLVNGVIEGNKTKLKSSAGQNIFRNCVIRGQWSVKYAYSTMFDVDLDAITLLKNLSVLSPHIRLSDNRDYNIEGKGEEIEVESLEAIGKSKPKIVFHTTDPNIEGIILNGNNVSVKGFVISDDYKPSNDAVYGVNNITIGNLIYARSKKGVVESLRVEDCVFSGGTSSSFVASSQTKKCSVYGCSFSGYIGDHAVYCSMKVESFIVKKCNIRDVVHTKGLFKIRSSPNAELFMLDNVQAHNLNGYMANVSLLETPNCELIFKDVTVTRDVSTNSIFYGFCLNDETGKMSRKGYNAKRLDIRDCNFEYGYDGNAFIYSGAGKRACIETINYINSKSCQSDFSGGISRFLNVQNCEFVDCCNINNKGMALMTSFLCIKNTVISDKDEDVNNCLFLINYADNQIESIKLKNIIVDAQVRYLFDVVKGDAFSIYLNRCTVSSLSKDNVLSNSTKCKVRYRESKCKFNK